LGGSTDTSSEVAVNARMIQGDVRTCPDLKDGAYDLIITDAFLSRFPTMDEKRQVMDRWVGLLAPQGWIVTTVRLGRADEQTPQEIEGFVDKVVHAGSLPQDQLYADLARQYACNIRSFPFSDQPSLQEFLDRYNADPDVAVSFVKGELSESVQYARVVLKTR
jgi:hypothetical protein